MISHEVDLPFPCSEGLALDSESYRWIALENGDLPKIQLSVPSFMESGVSECTGREFFHELYACYRTDDRMVGVRVLVSHIEYEIDPGMLLMACQQKILASTCSRREVFPPYGTEVDLLCIEPSRGSQDLITRNLCYKYGKYYLWLQAFCPRATYAATAGVLWDILRSCTVGSKLGEYAEPMACRMLGWKPEIEFVVPSRCLIVKTEISKDLCHVSVESKADDRVFSRVGIVISSESSFSKLTERAENILRVLGANFSRLELTPFRTPDGRFRRICEANRIELGNMELSYQAMALQCGKYSVWIDNLGVGQQDSVFWWLVSQRTYQLVAWSFQIGSEIVIHQ